MIFNPKFFQFTLVACMLTFGFPVLCERLNLSQGTMGLNGQANFSYSGDNIIEIGSGTMLLSVRAGYEYFVIDGLSVNFNLRGEVPFSGSKDRRVSVGPGVMYAFDTDSLAYPYIGSDFGIQWIQGKPVAKWALEVRPNLGVLLSLNEYIAVDLGIKSEFSYQISPKTQAVSYRFGTGFLGLRIFF